MVKQSHFFWSTYLNLQTKTNIPCLLLNLKISWPISNLPGDFNFHFNKPNDAKVVQFNSFLEMFDLIQHIWSPTHMDGNTLDLLITFKETTLKTVLSVTCYRTVTVVGSALIWKNAAILRKQLPFVKHSALVFLNSRKISSSILHKVYFTMIL